MTDLDIDMALALAIGWRQDQMYTLDGKMLFLPFDKHWKPFSHKYPGVILPIAKRYNAFPYRLRGKNADKWRVYIDNGTGEHEETIADDPATAVALAIIGKAKK